MEESGVTVVSSGFAQAKADSQSATLSLQLDLHAMMRQQEQRALGITVELSLLAAAKIETTLFKGARDARQAS